MEFSIFAKRRESEDGKKFTSFFGRIKKKDGTEISTTVHFRDTCPLPKPESCPMNIIVDKADANLSTKTYVADESGEVRVAYHLWVNKWAEGAPFVDHSLDDFE